ncbi:Hypothetical predicted protein [Pelobates cultripes]|uniref:Uncharacterized protein n=1 Tax=Pelobates cultripes TaxID=61616 RepID=A0AAD1VRZ7_PELCU|nr:Hypothetical predicted protein [Pelobates cultripes]
MGKKAKKLKTLTGNGSRDIADLLQPRPRPKMAPQIDAYSTSSEEELLDAPDEIPCSGSMHSPQREEDLTAPATKGDIKALLTNIRAFFNADLNIIREDITVVTARLQANEDAITSLAQKQESTNEHLLQLQAAHKSMQSIKTGACISFPPPKTQQHSYRDWDLPCLLTTRHVQATDGTSAELSLLSHALQMTPAECGCTSSHTDLD